MHAIRLSALTLVLLLGWSSAYAGQVEVLWLGHAATRITSVEGKVIMIDPFIRKNPKTPEKYKTLESLGKIDVILVTHGHRDHIGDLADLAKLTGAKVVGVYELVYQAASLGWLDQKQIIGMNKGGTVMPVGDKIKITMVPADHSSSLGLPEPTAGTQKFVYAGAPVGYVIELENGFKIYHTGDTGVFGDMALIGKLYKPDLVLPCIGGHFTMNPKDAAFALSELIKPKSVIPIHYQTFPLIPGTPAELKAALGKSPIVVMDVQPGQAVKF